MGPHNYARITPCPCIKYWPKDGSLEPKIVANCVNDYIYIHVCVVFA
jgi:hypothetical protein